VSRRVALLGTRYPDLSIEEEVFGPAGIETIVVGADDIDEIVAATAGVAAIVAANRPRFTRQLLERLDCRVIVRAGIGVDSVDLDAARDLGYTVANVPDYGTEAVAQHTLALALAATRRLVEADRIVRSGGWGFADLRPLHVPSAMTAGVVGFGRIGRRVADLLGAVGFGSVVAHDAYVDPAASGTEARTLSELLAQSDVVCLHAPVPDDGGPLLGPAEIGSMRRGSALVNTSRGALVDQTALADGLEAGAPRVAALDVFAPEPPDLTPFRGVEDRLILSPHMAWYTDESQADLRRKSAEETVRIITGAGPAYPIVVPEEPT